MMAPEVIKRSLYSHASDSWSFGVVLWEMLIGQAPYKNLQYHTVLYKIGEHNLTLPIPSNMDAGFANIMHGCWDINVGSRLTFNQIGEKLNEVLEQFGNNFNLSGEEFADIRRRDWYPDINYHYLNNFGGGQTIAHHLVEELIQAHKEKRDAQLKLAARELEVALASLKAGKRKMERKSAPPKTVT